MLTLFHAPMSRSTRIVQLIDDLGALDRVEIRDVTITRFDGSGGRDAANPHPEGKVPLLVHDGVVIWESTAIALYLAELFPEAGLALPVGHPERGRMLSWLAWYGDVVEPVIVLDIMGASGVHATRTFRGVTEMQARLTEALQDRDWLAGGRYTVADLIVASTFMWQAKYLPDDAGCRDWFARCRARPAAGRALARDQAAVAA